jgi:8-oxo-dGTP diphosphatase
MAHSATQGRSSVIEVAAAVLLRPDGSFLLARRPAGKVYAGYWEFPGGKVEPGEGVEAALARELHEELGIDVERSDPWITRVFSYPHGTVRLNFRRIHAWRGEPHPREDQAIAWQRMEAPMLEPMLPANAPVLASLALPTEYAVTAAERFGVPRMLGLVERRMAAGLKMLQVREPGLDPATRNRFTRDVLALARRYGCKVLVKEPQPGADGVHLTAAELMKLERRPDVPLAGASCHTRSELDHAMASGLDFAVVGPVKETASHPHAQPLGWPRFSAMVAGSAIPVYAIGGLAPEDLHEAMRAGAHGVAMIGAAWRERHG